MNLRVRKVTGCSRSAIFAVFVRSIRKSAYELVSRQMGGLEKLSMVAGGLQESKFRSGCPHVESVSATRHFRLTGILPQRQQGETLAQ
jgi:hypothetical protein